MNEELLKKAKERIVRSLQFSDKPETGMRQKLKEDNYPAEVIDAAIEWAKSKKYLDDERFAESFIRLHGDNTSKEHLRLKLIEKGVNPEIIGFKIEDAEIDEAAQIRRMLERKHYSSDMDEKEKQKIIASLARKGYSWSTISHILGTVD